MTDTTDFCCDDVPLRRLDDPEAVTQLAVRGFVALWRGEQPAVADLAATSEVVETLIRAGRLEIGDRGHLRAVHGLVARPTRHRIEHEGGAIHTWCAFDAIGIPATLAIDATAVTSCPTCGAELRVELHHGDVADPRPLRLWLPNAHCDHLVDDFCAHANLYCDIAHLRATTQQRPGRTVTVADVLIMGRRSWADVAAVLNSNDGT